MKQLLKGGYAPHFVFALILSITSLFFNELQAQCRSLPASGVCSGGNGQATNGVNINSGQTYWYAGAGSFSNGVNLNAGGTLRVCGSLTLSNVNFNGGNIFIEAGGKLTINGGGSLNMNGNSVISNRGELTINKTIVMQNANNAIFNEEGAILNMAGGDYRLDINSSTSVFVNHGTANIHTLFAQGSASGTAVCLGANSCTNLTNLNNNLTNSFDAPGGQAVVRYTGNALLNSPLTNSENVVVCRATGATTSGGSNFGRATVVNNCASCEAVFVPLPIELLFFNGKPEKESIGLSWATTTELNNDYFSIEKSTDGIDWLVLENIPGAGNSTMNLQYTFKDNAPEAGIQYYRLKQTDFDGTFTYSAAIAINFEGSANANSISIYPNPNSSNQLNLRGIGFDLSYTLEVKKVTGELLYTQMVNTHSIALPDLEKGMYLITMQSADNAELKTFKYIVI